jgi:outer membrane protein TolC
LNFYRVDLEESVKQDLKKLLLTIACTLMTGVVEASVSLDTLIETAIAQDPWLAQSRSMEAAFEEEAVAAGQLPDPKFSAALANMPVDTFSFSQEPMTQVKLGVTQMFPAGQSRKLEREKKQSMGVVQRLQREQRIESVRLSVRRLWLDACLADLTVARIDEDRELFEQLVEVTRASYRSATRRVGQQDLVRSQVELTRLDERILKLKQSRDRSLMQLSEWVPENLLTDVSCELPDWRADVPRSDQFVRHPEVRVFDQKIAVKRAELGLAEASGQPGWSLNTSYAFRDEDRAGNDLADFVSVGVTFDLPLFKRDRQDRQVAAAAERVNAMQSTRLLLLKQLMSRYNDARALLQRLEEQAALYDDVLLEQMKTLSRSALNAYTSDQGDFADVMRAYVAELNARVETIRIRTEMLKTIAQLKYLNAGNGADLGE